MEQNMKSAAAAIAVILCVLVTTGFSSQVEVAGELNMTTNTAAVITKEVADPVVEEEQARQAEIAAYKQDQELLAALIFCEAGNQPYEGQVAVGAVVLNRVRSSVYPNSISAVIYQPGQFGPASSGKLSRVLSSKSYTDSAMQAAADAIAGANPISDCLYFGCGNYGMKIGDHYFH